MRVKRFVANDIQTAITKIKNEMGNDAVILHTRYFKEGGILGFFKKKYVEVTAATEGRNNLLQRPLKQLYDQQNIVPLSRVQSQAVELPIVSAVQKTPDPLAVELADMKAAITQMSELLENNSDTTRFPKLGRDLLLRLKKQEVEEKNAERAVKATLQQLPPKRKPQAEKINELLSVNLAKPLKKSKPIIIKNTRMKKPKIYAMVGPTGVGKTTTLAKLASTFSVIERKKVAFITIDTYRIAAAEQLKVIGEIMGTPVIVVYSLAQLQESLAEVLDNDIIFIDTAGRSHKNSAQMEELKNYLEIAGPDEIFLALSCTAKYSDMLNIIAAYEDLKISRLIFTKLDETSYYGAIYNVACKSKYPLSYFTTGQGIPDDIEVADPAKLVQLLMKE